MPRPVEALIHTEALAHNLTRARAAAPDAKVWAIVKANAYGHGIAHAYAGLKGADGFALLDLNEAERIRALGWRGPILLLEGCFEPRDLELCSRLNLWHTVHHEAQIDWLAAHKTHVPHQVFLKMNSGMNRLGFRPARYQHAWQRLSGLTQVESIVLMTHLSDADGTRGIAHQLAVFEAATCGMPGERTLANSAATLRFGPNLGTVRKGHEVGVAAMGHEVGLAAMGHEVGLAAKGREVGVAAKGREVGVAAMGDEVGVAADWVRPGIMVYGSSPDFPEKTIADWGVRPAMSLRAEVIAVQDVKAGEQVGYGSRFTAERDMRIGVVACGYADGYPRVVPCAADDRTPVLIGESRTRLVGRVSMDMITIDLTPAPEAGVGSIATLWGTSPGGAVLAIDEIAAAAGTVGYELMCALAPRVPTRADPG